MGSYTATYRIPKDRVTVQLLLRNQAPRRIEVFVPLQAEPRAPGKILRELLEQDRPFFPGHDLDDDAFVLVHRDAVVWAAVDKDPDRELGHLELYDHRVRVQVALSVGTQLQGEVYYTAPSAQARLMDHLNGPERFVFLHDGDRLVLVNKRFIDFVTERPARSPSRSLPAVSDPEEAGTNPDPEESRGED